MARRTLEFLILFVLLLAGSSLMPGQEPTEDSWVPSLAGRGPKDWNDTAETITQYVYRNIRRYAPKAYIQQLRTWNSFHRSGYVGVAFDAAGGDGIMSFLQSLKFQLGASVAMPRHDFIVYGVPLPNNWNVPFDPWSRVWWMANPPPLEK